MTKRAASPLCGRVLYWVDGAYEGNCELPEGHEGDHYDGMTWFDDGNESKDWAHDDDEVRACGEVVIQPDDPLHPGGHDRPAIAMTVYVSQADQQRVDAMRERSYRLAITRGHIRR